VLIAAAFREQARSTQCCSVAVVVDGGLGGSMSQGTANMRHAAGHMEMDEEGE
jgi:hypothetical protein